MIESMLCKWCGWSRGSSAVVQEKEVAAEGRPRSDDEGIVGGEGSLRRVQAGRCKSAAEAGAAER